LTSPVSYEVDSTFNASSWRIREVQLKNVGKLGRIALVAVTLFAVAGVGIAVAATNEPSSNASSDGRGIDEYGMTKAFYQGRRSPFTYTKGFFCDTSVTSTASSKCEAGQTFNTPPAAQHDPLYITVPLGFDVPMNMQDCPATLVCVDHPGTIDLTRLESSLKPLYPNLSDADLTQALSNFAVPGHDHFITDLNEGKPEWWDVQIVGVTSPTVLKAMRAHANFKYIQRLIDKKDPNVIGPIPTNLFLFFAAK
jgi:hypothetical protein